MLVYDHPADSVCAHAYLCMYVQAHIYIYYTVCVCVRRRRVCALRRIPSYNMDQ